MSMLGMSKEMDKNKMSEWYIVLNVFSDTYKYGIVLYVNSLFYQLKRHFVGG